MAMYGENINYETPVHLQQGQFLDLDLQGQVPDGRDRDGGRPAQQLRQQEAPHPHHVGLDGGCYPLQPALREAYQLRVLRPCLVRYVDKA